MSVKLLLRNFFETDFSTLTFSKLYIFKSTTFLPHSSLHRGTFDWDLHRHQNDPEIKKNIYKEIKLLSIERSLSCHKQGLGFVTHAPTNRGALRGDRPYVLLRVPRDDHLCGRHHVLPHGAPHDRPHGARPCAHHDPPHGVHHDPPHGARHGDPLCVLLPRDVHHDHLLRGDLLCARHRGPRGVHPHGVPRDLRRHGRVQRMPHCKRRWF